MLPLLTTTPLSASLKMDNLSESLQSVLEQLSSESSETEEHELGALLLGKAERLI